MQIKRMPEHTSDGRKICQDPMWYCSFKDRSLSTVFTLSCQSIDRSKETVNSKLRQGTLEALATYVAKVVCRPTTKSSGERFVHRTVFEAGPAYSSLGSCQIKKLDSTQSINGWPTIFKPKVRQKTPRESAFDYVQHLHQCRNTDLGRNIEHTSVRLAGYVFDECRLADKPPVDQVQETLQRHPWFTDTANESDISYRYIHIVHLCKENLIRTIRSNLCSWHSIPLECQPP